jgi:hypothetical protein
MWADYNRTVPIISRPPGRPLGSKDRPIMQRILESIVVDPRTDCHVWRFAVKQGYPSVTEHPGGDLGQRRVPVHRYLWERELGPIPEGLTIDHFLYNVGSCVGRTCVNVQHMRLVTQAENTRAAPHVEAKAAQTSCKRGHPFDRSNTYLSRKRKNRSCKTCARRRLAWNDLPLEAPAVPDGWAESATEFERKAVAVLRRLASTAGVGLTAGDVGADVLAWLLHAGLARQERDGWLRLAEGPALGVSAPTVRGEARARSEAGDRGALLDDLRDWVLCPCGRDGCLERRTLVVLRSAKNVLPKEHWDRTVEVVKILARSSPGIAVLQRVAQSDLLADAQCS